jgi:predicted DNA-binding transcriptional regulator AlpA
MERYLSQSEIGRMLAKLNMGDQRKIAVWLQRGKLPKPAVYIGKIPGWEEATINKWLQNIKCNSVCGSENEKPG